MKESWKNVPEKTRKLVIAIAAGTLAIALIAIAVLKFGANSEYSDLFTGLSQKGSGGCGGGHKGQAAGSGLSEEWFCLQNVSGPHRTHDDGVGQKTDYFV